jgi:predicted PhzF superfamily epimerase YddE/YHI9
VTIYQVDAFTDKPFTGNPAGVCILPSPADGAWMQLVAAEMNLSETAFLVKQGHIYNLRWFTPSVEVDLCGHATLAGAHILWETGAVPDGSEIEFSSLSGTLGARKDGEWIELDFPVEPPQEVQPPGELLAALQVKPLWVGRNRLDYMVEVDSEITVREINPHFSKLMKVPCRGVIVTSRAHSHGYDFVSRFFAPASGIYEDPVTGSAHCCLTPYWQEKLRKKPLVARQVSKREGLLRVSVERDRTLIAGRAVTVLHCELLATRA